MPVRVIKQIKVVQGFIIEGRDELMVEVPKVIVQGFHLEPGNSLEPGDMFRCEFKKHFDSNKRLIAEINEHMKLYYRHMKWTLNRYLKDLHYIRLTDLYLMEEYGFLNNEYLEIIFKEIIRTSEVGIIFTKTKTETIPIFPKRMVEDLDFVPE